MDIINEIESSIDEIIIEDDVNDSGQSPQVKDLIIVVKSPSGEEKEIIIKYTE